MANTMYIICNFLRIFVEMHCLCWGKSRIRVCSRYFFFFFFCHETHQWRKRVSTWTIFSYTYIPIHVGISARIPAHRLMSCRSVEPVELVRRPPKDSALYKVDRPMDHVFIRRTYDVSVHRALEVTF